MVTSRPRAAGSAGVVSPVTTFSCPAMYPPFARMDGSTFDLDRMRAWAAALTPKRSSGFYTRSRTRGSPYFAGRARGYVPSG